MTPSRVLLIIIGCLCIIYSSVTCRLFQVVEAPDKIEKKILPPVYPHFGPFGFFSSGLLCPFVRDIGPWRKTCAGPVLPKNAPKNSDVGA